VGDKAYAKSLLSRGCIPFFFFFTFPFCRGIKNRSLLLPTPLSPSSFLFLFSQFSLTFFRIIACKSQSGDVGEPGTFSPSAAPLLFFFYLPSSTGFLSPVTGTLNHSRREVGRLSFFDLGKDLLFFCLLVHFPPFVLFLALTHVEKPSETVVIPFAFSLWEKPWVFFFSPWLS